MGKSVFLLFNDYIIEVKIIENNILSEIQFFKNRS